MGHKFNSAEIEIGLKETSFHDPSNFVFPAGVHICEVEVDTETGLTKIASYTAVDDFGTIINPMIVEGQVQGGVAQGIGQALLEGAHYDRDSGQLLTGSYMDYNMPKAANMPHIENFKLGFTFTKCPSNPLGMKGCGEAGRHRGTSRRDQRHHPCPRGARHCHAGNAAHRVECHAAHETRRRIRGQKWKTSIITAPQPSMRPWRFSRSQRAAATWRAGTRFCPP